MCQEESQVSDLSSWEDGLYLPKIKTLGEKLRPGREMKSLWDFQVEIPEIWRWDERSKTASMNLGVINIDFVIETKEVSEKSEKR